MTDTPSGNRWERADDGTQPLAATPPAASPDTTPEDAPDAGSEAPAAPIAVPEYGWAPTSTPTQAASSPRPERRRAGLLTAGAAALLLGAGAGGYAIGAATADSDAPGIGTTRQGPPAGFTPGGEQGFPGRDDDHDEYGGPGGEAG